MDDYPTIKILPGEDRRLRAGSPWLYSNELRMDEAAKAIPPGSVARLMAPNGKILGLAHFNPRTLIAARLLTRNKDARVDRAFVERRLARALQLRERLFAEPYYRLIHAEADGLPGLVVDRFGKAIVCQFNTAGMALLEDDVLAALDQVIAPEIIVLRNDSSARLAEGLGSEVRVAKGTIDGAVELVENGAHFSADLLGGQKTGWFFDQRATRRFMSGLARDLRVLDLYTFAGGFAVQAALAGAREVVAIDRSEPALALANEAALRNGVAKTCSFRRAEAFAEMERLAQEDERFDIVIADPPAFIKTKKDVGAGLRGYRKLAHLAGAIVAKGGFLFLASCSHNAEPAAFAETIRRGIADTGRNARILRTSGADADHPVHPALPESAYLKAQIFLMD